MSITNFFKRSVTEEELPGKAGMEVPTAKKARLDDDVAAPPADGKNLAPLFGGKYGPVQSLITRVLPLLPSEALYLCI